MIAANDTTTVSDIVRIRRTLQASVEKLLDAQAYLAGQLVALDAVEHHVRALALREGSRFLGEEADSDALRRHGELQAETNANFRQMHETATHLRAQIAALLRQHERLYNATFAQGSGTGP